VSLIEEALAETTLRFESVISSLVEPAPRLAYAIWLSSGTRLRRRIGPAHCGFSAFYNLATISVQLCSMARGQHFHSCSHPPTATTTISIH